MSHWAAGLIGLPWTPERNCWWLCREAFRMRWGIALPELTASGVRAIKGASDDTGVRPLENASPRDGDIVVMRSVARLHAGIVANANNRLGVLHSAHDTGVIWQPWAEATDGMNTQLWRLT